MIYHFIFSKFGRFKKQKMTFRRELIYVIIRKTKRNFSLNIRNYRFIYRIIRKKRDSLGK